MYVEKLNLFIMSFDSKAMCCYIRVIFSLDERNDEMEDNAIQEYDETLLLKSIFSIRPIFFYSFFFFLFF